VATCAFCPSGTYQPGFTAEACLTYPSGQFQPMTGQVSCQATPAPAASPEKIIITTPQGRGVYGRCQLGIRRPAVTAVSHPRRPIPSSLSALPRRTHLASGVGAGYSVTPGGWARNKERGLRFSYGGVYSPPPLKKRGFTLRPYGVLALPPSKLAFLGIGLGVSLSLFRVTPPGATRARPGIQSACSLGRASGGSLKLDLAAENPAAWVPPAILAAAVAEMAVVAATGNGGGGSLN